MKSLVAFEAFVVGIVLVLFYYVITQFKVKPLPAVFLSGALFHLTCEFTGVNAWYAKHY